MLAGVDAAVHAGRHPHGDRADRHLGVAIDGPVRELGPQLGAVPDETSCADGSQRAAAAWNVVSASAARSVKVSTLRC